MPTSVVLEFVGMKDAGGAVVERGATVSNCTQEFGWLPYDRVGRRRRVNCIDLPLDGSPRKGVTEWLFIHALRADDTFAITKNSARSAMQRSVQ